MAACLVNGLIITRCVHVHRSRCCRAATHIIIIAVDEGGYALRNVVVVVVVD